jgi:hypothetical protein
MDREEAVMTTRWPLWALTVVSVGWVAGCGDPFPGTWEEEDPSCDRPSEFTVEDDLTGDATVYADDMGCEPCRFDFEMEEADEWVYTGDVTVTTPACIAACDETGFAVCEVYDDGESGHCTVSVGLCTKGAEFVKVSD